MPSTTTAVSSSSPPATSTPSHDAAPIPHHGMSMSNRNLVIIIAVVVGVVITATVGFITISCRKKSARLRLFHRAVTPLSDAEFDLWRRPSKAPLIYKSSGTTLYKSTGTRCDGDVKMPAPICHVVRIDSKAADIPPRPLTPPQQSSITSPTLTNFPIIRPASSTTSKSNHKSSMSIQDRPPTPYSPSPPPSGWDDETMFGDGVPQSPRQKEHRVHVHYPSVSEASEFDFGFGYGSPESPRRGSFRRESWVHHSRRFSSLGQGLPSFQSFQLPDAEELKKQDF